MKRGNTGLEIETNDSQVNAMSKHNSTTKHRPWNGSYQNKAGSTTKHFRCFKIRLKKDQLEACHDREANIDLKHLCSDDLSV